MTAHRRDGRNPDINGKVSPVNGAHICSGHPRPLCIPANQIRIARIDWHRAECASSIRTFNYECTNEHSGTMPRSFFHRLVDKDRFSRLPSQSTRRTKGEGWSCGIAWHEFSRRQCSLIPLGAVSVSNMQMSRAHFECIASFAYSKVKRPSHRNDATSFYLSIPLPPLPPPRCHPESYLLRPAFLVRSSDK